MFRKMRRAERKGIPQSEAVEILRDGKRGVLAVNGDEGYPYAIPINYFYNEQENKIYFHSSRVGHKIDAIKNDSKVCVTVYTEPEIRDLDWAPYVRSVVAFGKAHLMEPSDEMLKQLKIFAMKYYPSEEEADRVIAEDINAVQMVEITIEHMTGKEIQEN